MSAALSVRAQDVFRSTSADGDQLPEAEPVVVSATRFDIPLDQSPASVSVIDTQDMDNKQIERVADALRAVPGLSVVQTGTPGQLTSVFMRGLPSQDMQVLLDLGKKYGSWDCADLGASGGYPIFSPAACAKGEIPDVGTETTPLVTPGYHGPAAPSFIYFPPRLHLHVRD